MQDSIDTASEDNESSAHNGCSDSVTNVYSDDYSGSTLQGNEAFTRLQEHQPSFDTMPPGHSAARSEVNV